MSTTITSLRKIGYARVMRDDPDLQRQRAAFENAGCNETFECPAGQRDWSALHSAIATLRSGDALLVWSLDDLDMPAYVVQDLVERHGASVVQLRR